MQGSAFVNQLGVCSNRIAFTNSLYMSATHIDTHSYLTRAQSQGSDTSNILGKSQRGTSTQESERLAVTLIHFHGSLKRIRLWGRYEMHAESLGKSIGLADSLY